MCENIYTEPPLILIAMKCNFKYLSFNAIKLLFICISTIGPMVNSYSQNIIINEEYVVNSGPVVAIPFCSDISVDYSNLGTQVGCLWFEFNVSQTSTISFSTQGAPAIIVPITEIYDNTCHQGLGDLNIVNQTFEAGTYYVIFGWPSAPLELAINNVSGIQCAEKCNTCLPEFSLIPNKTYLINAWTKQEDAPLDITNYDKPVVDIEAPVGSLLGTYQPSGPIIDGWQRIEGVFTTPTVPTSFKVSLHVLSGSALFDDIRIVPADGSMKCYVYDPVNQRFVAELDERHFATFYEYDNEGRLVRTKKETERGIMTIQETRESGHHAAGQ